MFIPKLEWYDKKDVLSIFHITTRTYFRKLKQMSPHIRTKKMKNPKGRDTTLIYYKDLLDCFEYQRKPKGLSNPESLRKYVGSCRWDFMGNIVPGKSLVYELISKMYFLYDNLKKLDKSTVVFFNIEKNTEDDFFHSHFLIRSSLKNKEIKELLFLICENELNGEKRIDLKKYDFEKYQFRGSLYSDKFGKFDSKHHSSYIHSQLLG
jgi:hypothetical protein